MHYLILELVLTSSLSSASEGWDKVMFSPCLSVYSSGGVPQSQVLSQVSDSRSFPRGTPVLAGGYPSSSKGTLACPGVPPSQNWGTLPQERLHCWRCTLCGFPQEDFLIIYQIYGKGIISNSLIFDHLLQIRLCMYR